MNTIKGLICRAYRVFAERLMAAGGGMFTSHPATTRLLPSIAGTVLLCALTACGGAGGDGGSAGGSGDPGDQTTSPSPTPVSIPAPAPGITQLQSCAGIMPLGDSITLGVNGGYRNNLYTGLQQDNCGVSYVGTLSDLNTHVADKDHEGHLGLTIGDIANSVNAWTASTQPNIVLLMAGTNDTAWWSAANADQIGARHDALIDQLRAARPDAWIFVASIPPQAPAIIQPNNIDRAVLTQELNAVIRRNVDARAAAGQRVRLVDVNSVLTTADLYDGIHPTEAAHAKIAQKFLEAMRAALGSA